ncbi:MAG: polysaccharide pyruvyl transferase family protein [Muribaculaceae bacterium]
MKVAAITFNHAHNHGSMLQTYALQQFVTALARERGVDLHYTVIDYVSDFQKELYAVFKHSLLPRDLLKNLIALRHYKALSSRHRKFEQFISQHCSLSRRYGSETELMANPPVADVYLSGSDQIWNVRARDFSPVYYLPFARQARRISYAASFGPLKIDWSKYGNLHIDSLLQQYRHISVREAGSADNVEQLTGARPLVHLDPTFLLTKAQWQAVQSDANYRDGRYILLYCLEPTPQQLQMAKTISEKLELPIVVLRYNNKHDWFNPFVHRYDAGPRDFLAYIDHAAMVLTSSFHGTAFSLIYHKTFYVFNGLSDNRIAPILQATNLTDRSLNTIEDLDRVTLTPINPHPLDTFINTERHRSAQYLTQALFTEND